MALHRQRQYHASGPQPISHSDIHFFIADCPEIPNSVVPKFKELVYSLDENYRNFYHEKN